MASRRRAMQRHPRSPREASRRIPGSSAFHASTRAAVSNPTKEFRFEPPLDFLAEKELPSAKRALPRESAIPAKGWGELIKSDSGESRKNRPRVATADYDVSRATLAATDDGESDTSAMKVFDWTVSCPDVRTIPWNGLLAINAPFVLREFFGDSPLSASADGRAPDDPASIRRGCSGLVERGEPAGIWLRRVRSRVSKPGRIRFRFTGIRHRSRRVSVGTRSATRTRRDKTADDEASSKHGAEPVPRRSANGSSRNLVRRVKKTRARGATP